MACVRRILKTSLPSSTNVGKDASAAFARASGIFIIYLTACANDFARENKRQTITANDVLAAVKVRISVLPVKSVRLSCHGILTVGAHLQELEFDEFTGEMMSFLETYRTTEREKKEAKAIAKKAQEAADMKEADNGEYTTAETPLKSTHESAAAVPSDEDEDDDVEEDEHDEDDVDDEEGPDDEGNEDGDGNVDSTHQQALETGLAGEEDAALVEPAAKRQKIDEANESDTQHNRPP